PQLRARMCGPGSRVSHYAMHVFNLLGVNSQYHRRPTHHQPPGFGRDPRTWAACLCEPELRHGGKRSSSGDVRNNDQLEDGDFRKGDLMLLSLAGCTLRAKIPLLTNYLLVRPAAIRRPTQDILLRAFSSGLKESQLDPPN